MQKNAPNKGDDSNNPMSADMEKLSNALNSDDLEAAKEAYSTIQEKVSQGPPQGGAPPQGIGVKLSRMMQNPEQIVKRFCR